MNADRRDEIAVKTGFRHLLLLLALTPLAGGCSSGEAAAPAPEPMADAVRREVARTVEIEGRVVAPPGGVVQVSSPGSALVRRVHVRPGARVEQGDPLVTLDFGSSTFLLARARWELQAAQESLAAAQDRFDALRKPALERLDAARGLDSGEDGWLLDGADASASDARHDLEVREAEAALAALDQQVAHAIMPEEWRVRVATEAVEAARRGQRELVLASPLEGEVRNLRALVGNDVSKDVPVATIIDVSRLQVEAPVGMDAVGLLQPDLPVELRFPNLPGRALEGRIEEVALTSPSPEGGEVTGAPRPAYLARIDFRNPDGDVLPDMSARVAVKLESRPQALAIPSEAVRPGPSVLVRRGEGWVPIEVTLGLDDGRFVEVESGLREGERVRLPQMAPDPVRLTAEEER